MCEQTIELVQSDLLKPWTHMTPEKDEKESWLNNAGKVAIVGALIALFAQLFGAIIPICLGPDLSDYNLLATPVAHEINLSLLTIKLNDDCKQGDTLCPTYYIYNNKSFFYNNGTSIIKVNSLHLIQRYNRDVSLTAISPPGFNVSLSQSIARWDQPVVLRIRANITYLINKSQYYFVEGNKYPIVIEGIGSDGKKRNCTILIGMSQLEPGVRIIKNSTIPKISQVGSYIAPFLN